jgi:hypothetical protein
MATDRVWPTTRVVAMRPDASPLRSLGTALMTSRVFGERNSPWPTPDTVSQMAMDGRAV